MLLPFLFFPHRNTFPCFSLIYVKNAHNRRKINRMIFSLTMIPQECVR